MNIHEETIKFLLENGCPSIQYRVRHEVLGESLKTKKMVALKREILSEDVIHEIFTLQKENGWISERYHTAKTGTNDAMESMFRYLCEKGLNSNDEILKKALLSMKMSNDEFVAYIKRHCENNFAEADYHGRWSVINKGYSCCAKW